MMDPGARWRVTAPQVAQARVQRPMVLDLRDEAALDPALSGGKAAALAKAGRGGLNPAPGRRAHHRRSPTPSMRARRSSTIPPCGRSSSRPVATTQALIARSSSVIEDTSHLVDGGSVRHRRRHPRPRTTWSERSRPCSTRRAGAGASSAPMAVLVQPMVEPAVAGVLFGIDPVTGRTDRRVVSAVEGSPEPLVSGAVVGARYVLDERGRAVHVERGDGPRLRPRDLRRLGRARHAGRRRVRRTAGRRVGAHHRGPAAPAAVASRHHRGARRSRRAGLRTRARSRRRSPSR